jgi:hypothetical protein
MSITDYTTYAEIRALLGVSDEEISDAELALPVWSLLLNEKLSDISEAVDTNRKAVALIPAANRTAIQNKFFNVSSLYAAYAVAQELLIALPMFGFSQLTDGKAEIQRFDKWADLKAGIEKGANAMRAKLRLALAALDPSYNIPQAVSNVYIVGTGIATDPVTGV